MADERTRYFRRLRRLRRATRRWSVLAGGLGGATAVLTPYAGLGLADAGWAGAAGGAAVLALFRWADLRRLAAQPAPEPPSPAEIAAQSRARIVAAVERLPAGAGLLAEVRRQRARLVLRDSRVAEPWARLDQAVLALGGMASRLTGPAQPVLAEATEAERSLRDLAERIHGIERAVRLAPADARPPLEQAQQRLGEQLLTGVTAYERLVAAAAAYLAEQSQPSSDQHPAATRLVEAADLLHGVATALAEFRTGGPAPTRNG